jgi:peroxiredoxin
MTASGTRRPASSARRLGIGLAAAMLLLIATLAALPFVASRPRPAPEVSMTTITGQSRSIAGLAGRPVLVSFWSTTCTPCMREMSAKSALHRRYEAAGLVTLAIAMAHDDPARVAAFASARLLPFDIVVDADASLAQAFDQTQTTPTKFLIDPQGRIVRVYVGGTDFEDLGLRIEGMLGG